MDRVAVIDADIILYKACRVAEEEINWGNDQWVLWSNLNLVFWSCTNSLSITLISASEKLNMFL